MKKALGSVRAKHGISASPYLRFAPNRCLTSLLACTATAFPFHIFLQATAISPVYRMLIEGFLSLPSSAMPTLAACCTCATLLSDTKIPYSTDSEKPLTLDRHLECCGRTICASCQYDNPRFQTYCPFCQISCGPNPLPANGLRLPPAYSTASKNGDRPGNDLPPAYSSFAAPSTIGSKPPETDDVVHYLDPDDSIPSLSLAYQVPVPILRAHNGIATNFWRRGSGC
jgi:hypothetical protein